MVFSEKWKACVTSRYKMHRADSSDALINCRLATRNVCRNSWTFIHIKRLKLVYNTAGRLVQGLRRQNHISSTLHSLHWLPMWRRIVLSPQSFCAWECVYGVAALAYLQELWVPVKNVRGEVAHYHPHWLNLPGCYSAMLYMLRVNTLIGQQSLNERRWFNAHL